MTAPNVFAGIAGIVVVAAIVTAIFIVGSPEQARLRRLDEERTRVMRSVSAATELYVAAHHTLPATLEQLAKDTSHGALETKDPETGAPLEYRKTGATTYQLCARFAAQNADEDDSPWSHKKGRQCFEFTSPQR